MSPRLTPIDTTLANTIFQTTYHTYDSSAPEFESGTDSAASEDESEDEEDFEMQDNWAQEEEEDSDWEEKDYMPLHVWEGPPQPAEGEVVLPSIELPPIAYLLGLPLTPSGLVLPPLRYLWED